MQQQAINKVFFFFIAFLVCAILYLLAPILTPFIVGALLAYLADPLVKKLMQLRLSRVTSVVIVFFLFFLMVVISILLIIPLIQTQVGTLIESLPAIVAWLQERVVPWLSRFGLTQESINVTAVKNALAGNLAKASGAADWFLNTLVHSGFKIVEWLINLILIPVVAFYLLCDWNKVIDGFRNLFPQQSKATIIRLMKECDEVLGSFLRGQLIVMLVLGVIYSAGLTLVGLQVGIVVGLTAGLMSIVPYLGFIVGIVIASIAGFVQGGSMVFISLIWLVFVIGHLIEHTVLVPYFLGNRIGLHPVAVIFAILAGGCLFGFIGILLAVPVASVIMVWLRYLYQRYRLSQIYHT